MNRIMRGIMSLQIKRRSFMQARLIPTLIAVFALTIAPMYTVVSENMAHAAGEQPEVTLTVGGAAGGEVERPGEGGLPMSVSITNANEVQNWFVSIGEEARAAFDGREGIGGGGPRYENGMCNGDAMAGIVDYSRNNTAANGGISDVDAIAEFNGSCDGDTATFNIVLSANATDSLEGVSDATFTPTVNGAQAGAVATYSFYKEVEESYTYGLSIDAPEEFVVGEAQEFETTTTSNDPSNPHVWVVIGEEDGKYGTYEHYIGGSWQTVDTQGYPADGYKLEEGTATNKYRAMFENPGRTTVTVSLAPYEGGEPLVAEEVTINVVEPKPTDPVEPEVTKPEVTSIAANGVTVTKAEKNHPYISGKKQRVDINIANPEDGMRGGYLQLNKLPESGNPSNGTRVNFPIKKDDKGWHAIVDTTKEGMDGDGKYLFKVEAHGKKAPWGYFGNSAAWMSHKYYMNVDNTAPEFEILSPEDGKTVPGTVDFKVKVTDDSGINKLLFNVGKDRKSWTPNSTNSSITKDEDGVFTLSLDTNKLDEGENHIVLRATDGAGNTKYYNNRKNLHAFTVDNKAPVVKSVNISETKKIDGKHHTSAKLNDQGKLKITITTNEKLAGTNSIDLGNFRKNTTKINTKDYTKTDEGYEYQAEVDLADGNFEKGKTYKNLPIKLSLRDVVGNPSKYRVTDDGGAISASQQENSSPVDGKPQYRLTVDNSPVKIEKGSVKFDNMIAHDGKNYTSAALNNDGKLKVTFKTDKKLKLVGSQIGLYVPKIGGGPPSTGWTKAEVSESGEENEYVAYIDLRKHANSDKVVFDGTFKDIKMYFRTVDPLKNTDANYYLKDEGFGKSSAAYLFTIDNAAPSAKLGFKKHSFGHYGSMPYEPGLYARNTVTVTGEADGDQLPVKHWFEVSAPDGKNYYWKDFSYNSTKAEFDIRDAETTEGDKLPVDKHDRVKAGEYTVRYVATDKVGNRNDINGSEKKTVVFNYSSPQIDFVDGDTTSGVTNDEFSIGYDVKSDYLSKVFLAVYDEDGKKVAETPYSNLKDGGLQGVEDFKAKSLKLKNGTYRFEIRAANYDGSWGSVNNRTVEVERAALKIEDVKVAPSEIEKGDKDATVSVTVDSPDDVEKLRYRLKDEDNKTVSGWGWSKKREIKRDDLQFNDEGEIVFRLPADKINKLADGKYSIQVQVFDNGNNGSKVYKYKETTYFNLKTNEDAGGEGGDNGSDDGSDEGGGGTTPLEPIIPALPIEGGEGSTGSSSSSTSRSSRDRSSTRSSSDVAFSPGFVNPLGIGQDDDGDVLGVSTDDDERSDRSESDSESQDRDGKVLGAADEKDDCGCKWQPFGWCAKWLALCWYWWVLIAAAVVAVIIAMTRRRRDA